MARSPFAPGAWVIVKLSVAPFHVIDPNAELFRPSSQLSICTEETTGTLRVCAELTMDARRADESWVPPSPWTFAVNAP